MTARARAVTLLFCLLERGLFARSRTRGAAARRESVGLGAGAGALAVARASCGRRTAGPRRGAGGGDAVARSSTPAPTATPRAGESGNRRRAAARWVVPIVAGALPRSPPACARSPPAPWRAAAAPATASTGTPPAPEPSASTGAPIRRPCARRRRQGRVPRPTAVAVRSPWTRQAWRAGSCGRRLQGDGARAGLPHRRRTATGRRGPKLASQLQDLQAALEAEGWAPAGRAEPWYGRRFVWQHADPPPGRGGPR